jgi:nucleoside-diphosphate-sugar epimerase
MSRKRAKSCLIVGCGYVGKPLADRLIHQGWSVGAVVKSRESYQRLAGGELTVFKGDVSDAAFWNGLTADWDCIVYCPSTGGGGIEAYQQIHDVGLSHCLQWMKPQARLIYTSSTSVYGQTDGEWVDESSPTEPLSESGAELVKAERRVCGAGQIVLRLGGIYGPDRGVLLKRLRESKGMIPEAHPKWLNLICLNDILAAIQHGLEGRLKASEVYNVIDSEPASYREIYRWLCQQLNLPLPPTGTPDYFGKRGMTNKRVSNQKLRDAGWAPDYPSFREGYQELL